jgi:hypothetical protein
LASNPKRKSNDTEKTEEDDMTTKITLNNEAVCFLEMELHDELTHALEGMLRFNEMLPPELKDEGEGIIAEMKARIARLRQRLDDGTHVHHRED